MYKNLMKEMAANKVSIESIANKLDKHRNTISWKFNGTGGKFGIKRSFKIKKQFFPSCTLEYLFKEDDAEKGVVWGGIIKLFMK